MPNSAAVLAAQLETLPHMRSTVSATDTVYIKKFHTKPDADNISQHTIIGVHVVIEKDNPNNIFNDYHVHRTKSFLNPVDYIKYIDKETAPKRAKPTLTIICDTLEVRTSIDLPEFDVTIHARELIMPDGVTIDTSPLDWQPGVLAKGAEPGQWNDKLGTNGDYDSGNSGADGVHGRDAGDINVFVRNFSGVRHTHNPCFVARGGAGQDGGIGANGRAGKSYVQVNGTGLDWERRGFQSHFDLVPQKDDVLEATYITYRLFERFIGEFDIREHYVGTKAANGEGGAWPTDGEAALSGGAPGEGGSGGRIVTTNNNVHFHLTWAGNSAPRPCGDGGKAGQITPAYYGGAPGQPVKSAHYHADCKVQGNIFQDPEQSYRRVAEHESRKGADAKAVSPKAPNGPSFAPDLRTDEGNAWLHPHLLQTMQIYVRDLALSGARGAVLDLLAQYHEALSLPVPTHTQRWSDSEISLWSAARNEFASIEQRIRMGLDYFGNPPGFMPLLSLQSSLRLYDLEVTTALRLILLAKWVEEKAKSDAHASVAAESTIAELAQQNAKTIQEMTKAEAQLTLTRAALDDIQTLQATVAQELASMRDELRLTAQDNVEHRARVKLLVRSAQALMTVIPYGQPVLGAVSKFGDFLLPEEDDTPYAQQLGDRFSELMGAAKTVATKAQTAAKDAAEKTERRRAAFAKGGPDELKALLKEEREAKEKEERIAKKMAGTNRTAAAAEFAESLGPAITSVGKAVAGLRVPKSDIDAELSKLAEQSPKWKELSKKLDDLGKQKAETLETLSQLAQIVADGAARLSQNDCAAFTLRERRIEAHETVSPAAALFVAQIGQKAKMSLVARLYQVVKAYEASVFRPLAADIRWNLPELFEKIHEFLKGRAEFDFDKIKKEVEILKEVFNQNIRAINSRLIEDYDFGDYGTQKRGLALNRSKVDVAQRLDRFSEGATIIIDPLAEGLLPFSHERDLIRSIKLVRGVPMAAEGSELPTAGTLSVTLETGTLGIVRRDGHLFGMRPKRRKWVWTYDFSKLAGAAQFEAMNNKSKDDVLNTILELSDSEIKDKLSMVPLWTDMKLSWNYAGPRHIRNFKLVFSELVFEFEIDCVPSDERYCALYVRGRHAREWVQAKPADIHGRLGGMGQTLLVYRRGQEVSVDLPETIFGGVVTQGHSGLQTFDERRFSNFELRHGNHIETRLGNVVKVTMNGDAELIYQYGNAKGS